MGNTKKLHAKQCVTLGPAGPKLTHSPLHLSDLHSIEKRKEVGVTAGGKNAIHFPLPCTLDVSTFKEASNL